MRKPEISYIMFECPLVRVLKDFPSWVLEVYIEMNDSNLTAHLHNPRNIYCINSLGIIDSLSSRPVSVHEFTESCLGYNILEPPAFISYRGQRYYGDHHWVACNNIDNLRFSNLSVQENNKLVEDIRRAITEFYL